MKKTLISLSVSAVMLMACSSEKENKTAAEKYRVILPLVMDTVFNIEYVADIHSFQNVEIKARVNGYIERIHIDEGEFVKAGQTLFTVGSKHYQQELIKAKALLKSAIADARAAGLNVKNVQTLVDKNIVSKTELEMAEVKLEAANAKVEEAKSDETAAALNLSLAEIKAPFDGVIDRIPFKTGSLIDEGTLLTSLSDNREVFAYFNLSEKEYLDFISSQSSKKKKEAVLILANNQEHKQDGVVETVDGKFNKNTGNIAFRAKFSNPDGILKHGSSGKVRLTTDLKNAMIIPQKSTFEIQEKTYVFVVDKDNTVQMKSFVPKLRLSSFYIVESGLLPTDKIIYEGIQRVKEGDKIIAEPIPSKEMLTLQIK
jgi:membrane fusion protein (multidrug efflux system)